MKNTTTVTRAIEIVGSQKDLAKKLGLATPSPVSIWRKNGYFPKNHWNAIEKLTNGAVNIDQMRFDRYHIYKIDMNCIDIVLEFIGSQTKLVQYLKVTQQAISLWLRLGYIPKNHWTAIQKITNGKVSISRMQMERKNALEK